MQERAKGKYQKWLEPDNLILLEAWARNGLTDEQIAHNMGITTSTLYDWKNKYSDISESLKKGKEVVDILVENALLKRALGYSYKETTRERIVDTGQKKRHGGESALTEKEWDFAIKYFDEKCCYCGEYMNKPTKDHIKPLKMGGTLSRDNIIPCCQKCNSSKKDSEMLSWYQSQPFYEKNRVAKIYQYIQFIMSLGEEFWINDSVGEMVVTKVVEKEVIPDTTAQIFWLKNRKPHDWRDKAQVDTEAEFSKVDDLIASIDRLAGGE